MPAHAVGRHSQFVQQGVPTALRPCDAGCRSSAPFPGTNVPVIDKAKSFAKVAEGAIEVADEEGSLHGLPSVRPCPQERHTTRARNNRGVRPRSHGPT